MSDTKVEALAKMQKIGINIYRPLSLESLRMAYDALIDVSHWVEYNPRQLKRQVEVAEEEGVTRQAIHIRVLHGRYKTTKMENGDIVIVTKGAQKLK